MSYLKNLGVIFLVSFALAVLGFILDWNDRLPDIGANILDLGMVTLLLFVVISVIYFAIAGLVKLIEKSSK